MTIVCDVLLALAFLTTLLSSWALSLPSGPEGPVGGWLLFLPPLGFLLAALVLMVSRHQLDWIPGGLPVRIGAAAGVLIAFVVPMIAAIDGDKTSMPGAVLQLVPYVVVIGCAMVVHSGRISSQWLAGSVFLLAALSGAGLAGFGVVSKLDSDMKKEASNADRRQAQDVAYEAQEVAEFKALPASTNLSDLMRFTWSRNEGVRSEAISRVKAWPDLETAMIELLNNNSENVVTYVSHVMDKPPASLAPAWGAMLERQLKNWNVLQYDEYAVKWEPNLSVYFEGARKIQESGGNLTPQLKAWYEFLKKCKGLDHLADYVRTLIRSA